MVRCNLGTINPNIALGGPSTVLSISVSNFVNDGIVSTESTMVGQTPARLNIVSPEFRNYGTINIDGVEWLPQRPARGAGSHVIVVCCQRGPFDWPDARLYSHQRHEWRNYEVVAGETWYGWINNQGVMELVARWTIATCCC